jgi:hypothetical protein
MDYGIKGEISNYDILHKAMWNSYNKVKEDNFKMEGLDDIQQLEILEFFLLPYFIKYEYFEVCNELKEKINLIKSKQK